MERSSYCILGSQNEFPELARHLRLKPRIERALSPGRTTVAIFSRLCGCTFACRSAREILQQPALLQHSAATRLSEYLIDLLLRALRAPPSPSPPPFPLPYIYLSTIYYSLCITIPYSYVLKMITMMSFSRLSVKCTPTPCIHCICDALHMTIIHVCMCIFIHTLHIYPRYACKGHITVAPFWLCTDNRLCVTFFYNVIFNISANSVAAGWQRRMEVLMSADISMSACIMSAEIIMAETHGCIV